MLLIRLFLIRDQQKKVAEEMLGLSLKEQSLTVDAVD
jgi:hypothetical protein